MSLPPLPELTRDLTSKTWRKAGRALLAKALGEFAYEELLHPTPVGGPGEGAGEAVGEAVDEAVDGASAAYRIDLPGGVAYRFTARRGTFGSWWVDPSSVCRAGPGEPEHGSPVDDPFRFLLDAREALGVPGDTAGHLVRELTATLLADATSLGRGRPSAGEIADLSYAELEGHQTGHPWIVPNKGRLGFSASDAARWAPEARRPTHLPWIAVHHRIAEYRAVDGLGEAALRAAELDPPVRERFAAEIVRLGGDPDAYHWLPVHPWQWDQIVAPLFAPEIAARRVLPLGEATDRYLPQQSIRTFTNIDRSDRHHLKLPLSVLNTLVWRGLPTERTLAAPAVTSWVLGLRDADPFLAEETGVVLLGEVASVTVRHPVLEELPGVPYQYRELLGAIWRTPIEPSLDGRERARTLAALLWADDTGRALVAELVARSGLSARAWLARLFGALLPPLLHFLYRYGVVFSPHGENAIVVFDADDVPVRLAVKDFVDDVNVSAKPLPELAGMPEEVSGVLLREPPEMLCQFVQSGLFVGVFRYLADICERQLGVPEREFWTMVRAEVIAYQRRFPELGERFGWFDLLAPEIDRLCLNRNRLLLDGYRDRPERPHAAVHGRVPNPLAQP